MMRVCVVLACLALYVRGADPLQRESPQSAVISFLQACHAHDYGRASAAAVIVVLGTIIIATFALRTVSSLFKQEAGR